MKRITLLLLLAALLLVANGLVVTRRASAMGSAGYKLDWFTLMTGTGGRMSSAKYAAQITVGQSVIGGADSASYDACLGYWCGAGRTYTVFLPLVVRGS